jgi:hypothetical protein
MSSGSLVSVRRTTFETVGAVLNSHDGAESAGVAAGTLQRHNDGREWAEFTPFVGTKRGTTSRSSDLAASLREQVPIKSTVNKGDHRC